MLYSLKYKKVITDYKSAGLYIIYTGRYISPYSRNTMDPAGIGLHVVLTDRPLF